MKNLSHNYILIMAGGIGTRFWPFSRTRLPKQFHDLQGSGKTMLQDTVARFEGVCPLENIYIVTSRHYKQIILEQLPMLAEQQVLTEPARKNTAPCIAYGCYKILSKDPEANILVAPADHVIGNDELFRKTALKSLEQVKNNDVLVTFGISPSRPDTGYGYIQYHQSKGLIGWLKNSPFKKVKTFTEKPALELAKTFVESGEFLWNAGIFVWSGKAIVKALEQHIPEIAEAFAEAKEFFFSPQEAAAIEKAYSLCRNISIDFAVMEKADNVYVIPCDFGWSDLGTWKSLYEISEKDEAENVVFGTTLLYDTQHCIIKTPSERLVVVKGLDNFIIAEHENVLLICPKDDEQQVKDMVADAKKKGKEFG